MPFHITRIQLLVKLTDDVQLNHFVNICTQVMVPYIVAVTIVYYANNRKWLNLHNANYCYFWPQNKWRPTDLSPAVYGVVFTDSFHQMTCQPEVVTTARAERFFVLVSLEINKIITRLNTKEVRFQYVTNPYRLKNPHAKSERECKWLWQVADVLTGANL